MLSLPEKVGYDRPVNLYTRCQSGGDRVSGQPIGVCLRSHGGPGDKHGLKVYRPKLGRKGEGGGLFALDGLNDFPLI